MRILSSAHDPVHAMIESFDRTVGDCALQTHVVHTLIGCLGTGEIPLLGVGGVAQKSGKRVLMMAHGVNHSCKPIANR